MKRHGCRIILVAIFIVFFTSPSSLFAQNLISIPTVAFRPMDSAAEYDFLLNRITPVGSDPIKLYAPLVLPQGAIVDYIILSARDLAAGVDQDDGVARARLYRVQYNIRYTYFTAETDGPGTPGDTIVFSDSSLNLTINNAANTYFLEVYLDEASFYDVKVQYHLPSFSLSSPPP